jgi:hypothetical protein
MKEQAKDMMRNFSPEQIDLAMHLNKTEGDEMFHCIQAVRLISTFSPEQTVLFFSLLKYGHGAYDTALGIENIKDFSDAKANSMLESLKDGVDSPLEIASCLNRA